MYFMKVGCLRMKNLFENLLNSSFHRKLSQRLYFLSLDELRFQRNLVWYYPIIGMRPFFLLEASYAMFQVQSISPYRVTTSVLNVAYMSQLFIPVIDFYNLHLVKLFRTYFDIVYIFLIITQNLSRCLFLVYAFRRGALMLLSIFLIKNQAQTNIKLRNQKKLLYLVCMLCKLTNHVINILKDGYFLKLLFNFQIQQICIPQIFKKKKPRDLLVKF